MKWKIEFCPFDRIAWIKAFPAVTWLNDNVIITSERHRDVVWRNDNVIIPSCVRWVMSFTEINPSRAGSVYNTYATRNDLSHYCACLCLGTKRCQVISRHSADHNVWHVFFKYSQAIMIMFTFGDHMTSFRMADEIFRNLAVFELVKIHGKHWCS